MREYFNTVTSEDDLGDVLFSGESCFDDVKSKVNSLDDESQKLFTNAVKETNLVELDLSEDGD